MFLNNIVIESEFWYLYNGDKESILLVDSRSGYQTGFMYNRVKAYPNGSSSRISLGIGKYTKMFDVSAYDMSFFVEHSVSGLFDSFVIFYKTSW